jgi:hypothetical protein
MGYRALWISMALLAGLSGCSGSSEPEADGGDDAGRLDSADADATFDAKPDRRGETDAAKDARRDGAVTAESGTDSTACGDGSTETLSFAPATSYAAGGNPVFVATADFNGDGRADLAIPDLGLPGMISVLLGNGDGTFQPAVPYATATPAPVAIAVADFNGDGKVDLAVATDSGASGFSIFLGNGDGTFQAAIGYGVLGSVTNSIATADFNGDGKADLAVANGGSSVIGPVPSNYVSVVLGNGDGTFRTAVNYFTVGNEPSSIAIADLNGDGKADLAVADGLGTVDVLIGNGDGTFQTSAAYDCTVANAGSVCEPKGLAIADFNHDGKADIAVANAGPAELGPTAPWSNVSILLGNGDGTFPDPVNYAAGSGPISQNAGAYSPQSIVTADFNGDGNADLAVANYSDENVDSDNVSVLLGNGDGTFQTFVLHAVDSVLSSLATGDFNGDGQPDLAVANGNLEDTGSNSVDVLLNTSVRTCSVGAD